MAFRDMSFSCSHCEKTVFGGGYYLFGPGGHEGFCGALCLQAWINEKLGPSNQPKKVVGKVSISRNKKHN